MTLCFNDRKIVTVWSFYFNSFFNDDITDYSIFSVDGDFAKTLQEYSKNGVFSDAKDVLNGRQEQADELLRILQLSFADVTK